MKKMMILLVMMVSVVAKAQYVGDSWCENGVTTVELRDHMGNLVGYKKVQGNWTGLSRGLPLSVSMSKLDYEKRKEAALRVARETGGYVGYGYGGYGYAYPSYGGVGIGLQIGPVGVGVNIDSRRDTRAAERVTTRTAERATTRTAVRTAAHDIY